MTPFPTTTSRARMLIVGVILVTGTLAPVVTAEASAGSSQGITAKSGAVCVRHAGQYGTGLCLHRGKRPWSGVTLVPGLDEHGLPGSEGAAGPEGPAGPQEPAALQGSARSQGTAGPQGPAGPIAVGPPGPEPVKPGNSAVGFGVLKATVCSVTGANNSRFSSLAAAVAQATPGDTVDVEGTCVGSTTIDKDLTLRGVASANDGAPTLQGSSGMPAGGVLFVAKSVVVALDQLTITGGAATVEGGGIDNHGTLTLTGSIVRGNSSGQVGGGIINYGTLTLDNSAVLDNVAGNGTTSGDGGGIQNQGSVTLNNGSDIEGNAAAFGGGVENGVFGQAIASLTLNDFSRIDLNRARRGGGVENFASGAGVAETVTLNGTSSIDGNTVDIGGYGAGIDNNANMGGTASVTLNDSSEIATNTAQAAGSYGGLGGGILNSAGAGGTASISCPSASASITKNSADTDGGGIFEDGGTVGPGCAAIVTFNSPDDIS